MPLSDFIARLSCRLRLKSSCPACPPAIAEALLDILYHTLLCIRHCPNLRLARVAASHAHNIPALISTYDQQRLRMYWTADRNYLLRTAAEEGENVGGLLEAWNRHAAAIERELSYLCTE
ncbi:hypothetical protein [Chitinilyticum piscinae]|uniref:Uncharacterized protein n=1 Tax=Chitinilyticum piscinae TaxID=2866724 RepID=A0A8J7FK79_9NEIS|nr:hypothetical protein [Chitinilyticum piscinae]MBE9609482.1 hypothetical protein [Chitinilyticum piscinae]